VASSIIARRLLAEVKSVSATVVEFGRHLRHVAMNMPAPAQLAAADPVAEEIIRHLAELTDTVDESVQTGFIAANGGLLQTIMGSSRVRTQLLTELGKHAQRAAEELASRPDMLQSSWNGDATTADRSLTSPSAAPTELLQHGGSYRNLALIPKGSMAASKLALDGLGPNATVVEGIGADVVLCQEGWNVPLVRVAVEMIQSRRDYADFASRVLTRSDVSWTPLAAPRVVAAPNFGDSTFSDALPTMTQVL
jgi:hypothetical protein